jgi:hypothetical protein
MKRKEGEREISLRHPSCRCLSLLQILQARKRKNERKIQRKRREGVRAYARVGEREKANERAE